MFTPWLFWDRILIRFSIRSRSVNEFFRNKIQKFLEYFIIFNICKRSIGVPPHQTKCKRSRTAKPALRHKKISKKKVGQAWKITNFDRQAALFDGDSMEAITYRFFEVRQVGWHRRRDVQLIFAGNRCSQPLILLPFGRSGQELPVECQVEPFSSIFQNYTKVT